MERSTQTPIDWTAQTSEDTPIGSTQSESQGSSFGQTQGTTFTQQAKEKASEFVGKAMDAAETGKQKVGSGFSAAGGKLRETTENMGGIPGTVGRKISSGIETAGQYLQDKETGEIFQDLENYVRRHPVQSIAGAVVAGIVVGRILK